MKLSSSLSLVRLTNTINTNIFDTECFDRRYDNRSKVKCMRWLSNAIFWRLKRNCNEHNSSHSACIYLHFHLVSWPVFKMISVGTESPNNSVKRAKISSSQISLLSSILFLFLLCLVLLIINVRLTFTTQTTGLKKSNR